MDRPSTTTTSNGVPPVAALDARHSKFHLGDEKTAGATLARDRAGKMELVTKGAYDVMNVVQIDMKGGWL